MCVLVNWDNKIKMANPKPATISNGECDVMTWTKHRVHLKVYNPLKIDRVGTRCNELRPSRSSAKIGEVTCRKCLHLSGSQTL